MVSRGKVFNLYQESIMAKKPPKPPEERQRDNRANQLNPNDDAYWQSRGQPGRPVPERPPKAPPPKTDK